MPNHKRTMVYPNREATSIVGDRSPDLTLAIECWSAVLAEAARQVEGVFTAEEWNALAPVVGRAKFDPCVGQAGEMVAALLQEHGLPEPLVERVSQLDYAHTWAVVYACRHWKANNIRLPPNDRWWDLRHRLDRANVAS